MGSNPIVASTSPADGDLVTRAKMKMISAVMAFFLLTGYVPGIGYQDYFEHEAGIAAYFYFTPPTNLQSNLLRNLFRTISSNKPGYLIGFIPEEGYEDYSQLDCKVVIHNSGYAIAYFPKQTASSFTLRYQLGGMLKLENTLRKVAQAMEVAEPEIFYTHFQYPAARTMVLIEMVGTPNVTKNFDFRLPGANTYYERSWYISAPGLFCGLDFTLDNKLVRKVINAFHWSPIAAGDLVTNALHVASLRGSLTSSYFGMAILYSGSADLNINYAEGIRFIDLPEAPQALHDIGAELGIFYLAYLPAVMR